MVGRYLIQSLSGVLQHSGGTAQHMFQRLKSLQLMTVPQGSAAAISCCMSLRTASIHSVGCCHLYQRHTRLLSCVSCQVPSQLPHLVRFQSRLVEVMAKKVIRWLMAYSLPTQ